MNLQENDSIDTLQQAVRDFIDARNWRQFHSPKNLSMSIAIEAAELMEHFQWLTPTEAALLPHQDPQKKEAVLEELADVLIYCLSLADVLECNVAEIVRDKMAKNAEKYPVDNKMQNDE